MHEDDLITEERPLSLPINLGLNDGTICPQSCKLTYFKVPIGAIDRGLTVRLLPLEPENNFKLMVADVEAELKKGDALVYICNPNNPTGQLMMERDEIEYLVKKYPSSIFWVDEAYVQYISRDEHHYLSDLVPKHNNLMVSRTFSFAYGLAGVRMGYLLASESRIKEFESQVTNYRFGTLQEKMAVAALTDPDHLIQLRKMTAEDRDVLMQCLNGYAGIEAYESKTHFVLVKFTDGRKAKWLGDELLKRGIKIKVFRPIPGQDYTAFFRITLGVKNENVYLCEQLDALLG